MAKKPSNAKSNRKFTWDPAGNQRSAIGKARYCYLDEPDEYEGKRNWKIEVVFDPADPEFKAMMKHIQSFENDFLKGEGKEPIKLPACLKKDKETGAPFITFKATAKEDGQGGWVNKITVVDANRQPTTIPVWSGDTVRVAFSLAGMVTGFFTGAKPYLKAVQVLSSERDHAPNNAVEAFQIEDGFIQDLAAELPDQGEGEGDTNDFDIEAFA